MRILIIILILFLRAGLTSAQINDAGVWASINGEKKITQFLSANISQEFRTNENVSELGTLFTDAGLSYKINNIIRVSANYRLTFKRQIEDYYSTRHRWYVDLALRKKKKPIVVSFRTRIQSQYADVNSSKDGGIPEYYSRNKLSVKLDLDKKFIPYLSGELFTPLSAKDGFYSDNMRISGGLEYQFNKIHTIDFFLMHQREMNVANPTHDFIAGFGYTYSF